MSPPPPHPPTKKKKKKKKKEFYLKTQANLTEMFFVFYVLYVGMHDLSGDWSRKYIMSQH